jgi:hypothetical protein
MFWCHSIDIMLLLLPNHVSFLYSKIAFLVRIFLFSYLSVANLFCELIWAYRLFAATFLASYCDTVPVAPYLEFTTELGWSRNYESS